MSFLAFSSPLAARRAFLGRSGLLLSGAAVALLAGRDVLAAKSKGAGAGDVRILNTALGAELEAIAAYQLGAESGLLQKPVLELAVQFQGHHKAHADLLASTVQKLGGKPVAAKSKYGFPVEGLKTQADVLRFAAKLEQGPKAGEAIYPRCQACHALAYDRVGPRHCGLLGRRAGSVAGFDYSAAMKKSGIVWTAKTLDRFLADPPNTVPGTTMTYAGVPDPKERADLIAYLKQESASVRCRGA